jgi:hypothetical protein
MSSPARAVGRRFSTMWDSHFANPLELIRSGGKAIAAMPIPLAASTAAGKLGRRRLGSGPVHRQRGPFFVEGCSSVASD